MGTRSPLSPVIHQSWISSQPLSLQSLFTNHCNNFLIRVFQKGTSFKFFQQGGLIKLPEEMSFSGTQQKCTACDKTVHFIDMLSADGVVYHKTCFRCSQCNTLLVVSNYSSMDGVLYCKTHFEQVSKKFSAGKPPERPNELGRAPSKLSAMFGTQDKCSVCKKTVYPLEKVTVEGEFYHKGCFRCSHGGCNLNPSSYAALDGILYCKPHFNQLFREKGSYTHLTKTASLKKNAAAAVAEAAATPEAAIEPASAPEHTAEEPVNAAEE